MAAAARVQRSRTNLTIPSNSVDVKPPRGGEMVDARFGGIKDIKINMKVCTSCVCLDFRQHRLQLGV